jgi:two-component system, NarL family, sensor kinase
MSKRKHVEVGPELDFSDGYRLIVAREEERRKIAHELHDAFGQELVTVLLEMNKLVGQCKVLGPESNVSVQICDGLNDLASRIGQIAASISEVSHQLHPTLLERVGLRLALEQLCADLSSAGKTQVYFVGTRARRKVPSAVSLCLYRIAQEALHNIDKHAHATRAEMMLKEQGRSIVLRVKDHGVGYDPKQLGSHAGLGLSSMEERATSMGGAFMLKTAPGKGTEVTVQLPIKDRN